MKTPQAIVFPNFLPGLWNCRPIEKPNAPAACRGHGPASEQLAYEVFHPGAAVAQALQQSNVGKVREARGRSPRARRSQPCTVFERFWRLLRWLCEVKRSGTEHSQRKQISIAFPSRAARREQPFRPCAPDFRRAPARDMCPGGWPR